MSQSQSIEVDSSVLAKVHAYALRRSVSPQELASEALLQGLATMEEEMFWQERKSGAGVEEALRILSRAGRNNPPDPGDEMPEDLKYLLDERER